MVVGKANSVRQIRVHATNIFGVGATQLAQSLLPAMERLAAYHLNTVYLPCRGSFASYVSDANSTTLIRQRRYLPNSVSRMLECTLLARRFEGDGSLLVLGDIPLRCRGRQTVFVQTPLLTKSATSNRKFGAIIFWVARFVFRLNAGFASAFIVQTEAMKTALLETYPEIANKVHVISQPAPAWLLASSVKRTGVIARDGSELRLFYPAAAYPHKNHHLLTKMKSDNDQPWPVSSLILTIDENELEGPRPPWIFCIGRLEADAVLSNYETADGLLFLSLSESFGFPLVEAMWIGLPIICPDLPYARVLCREEAIYFEPQSVSSLRSAVIELHERLRSGWWPNWSTALTEIPQTWEAVAASMLSITAGDDT